jgi:hypothetical protein
MMTRFIDPDAEEAMSRFVRRAVLWCSSLLRCSSSVVVLLAGAVSGCSGGPASCDEASCDGAAEFCLIAGTDVPYESTSFTCRPLPAPCTSTPTCECLRTSPEAICAAPPCSCDETRDVVEVTLPGG